MIIFRYIIKGRGIAVHNLLQPNPRQSRLKISIWEFDPATNKSSAQCEAFIGEHDARLIAYRLLTGTLTEKYQIFGGSERNSTLEARILTVTKQDHGKPYLIGIQRGPGQRMSTRAIKPLSVTAQTSIMLDNDTAAKLALVIQDTLLAFFTTQYATLRAARTPQYNPQDSSSTPRHGPVASSTASATR